MEIEKFLPGVKKNVSLKNFTTFKIGGKAKYFFTAKTKEDLIKAVVAAKKFKLPFFILGGGSNLLVSDEGYNGLVIKIQNAKVKMQKQNSKCKINVEVGCSLTKLVSDSFEKNLTGLEWLAGIPGTIGGAIYGNAGAFEKSMGDIVKKVEVLDCRDLKIKKIKNKDCQFSYRNSIFKKNKNLIILFAQLCLKKGKKKEIGERMKKYLQYKKETQPLNYPSAGSVFKNPADFSAGELIQKCGLKGKRAGKAEISKKHANFIVNLGGAKAKDVKKLINLVKESVKKKFKINLEEEIQFLGFEN